MGLDCTTYPSKPDSLKFLLEGSLTVVVGIVSFWIVVDFPDDATFLNPLEKYVVASRLKEDGQYSYRSEKLKWRSVVAAFKDWKLYVAMCIGMGQAGSVYAFSLFLPSIINALGYSVIQAQLLTVPQYALAFITVCTTIIAVTVEHFSRICQR
jgi:hypothetical protein